MRKSETTSPPSSRSGKNHIGLSCEARQKPAGLVGDGGGLYEGDPGAVKARFHFFYRQEELISAPRPDTLKMGCGSLTSSPAPARFWRKSLNSKRDVPPHHGPPNDGLVLPTNMLAWCHSRRATLLAVEGLTKAVSAPKPIIGNLASDEALRRPIDVEFDQQSPSA